MRKRELLDSGIAGEKKVWAETAYAYDENGNGNCIRIRTPEGYVLHRFFDDRDRLAHQVLEDRENDIRLLTRFSYDRGGNLNQVVQQGREGQRELSCTYDLKDRLTGVKELGGAGVWLWLRSKRQPDPAKAPPSPGPGGLCRDPLPL